MSASGGFRFTLHRDLKLEHPRSDVVRACCVVFVMLNPSTADETANDATIRRCMRFAEERGYSRLSVVNLFPYRATRPIHLLRWKIAGPALEVEMILRENRDVVAAECEGRDVVIAWGANAAKYPLDVKRTMDAIAQGARNIYRLGPPTQDGHPRHPLYLPADAAWEVAS